MSEEKERAEARRLEEQAALFALMNQKSLELAERRLPRPALFVDLGCGDGAAMRNLPYRRILGVDRNSHSLERARRHLLEPRYKFLEADIESEEFLRTLQDELPAGPVMVRISLSLHHLHNPQGLLRSLSQLLRRGSVLLLLSPDQDMSCSYPDDTSRRVLELWEEDGPRPDSAHGRKVLHQMAEAGLRETVIAPYVFTTAGLRDRHKRDRLFEVFHGFRLHDVPESKRAEMSALLGQLREEFQEPGFFFMGTMMIGVGLV